MPVSAKLGDRLMTAVQVASLFATGWFVWTYHILPRLGFQTVAEITGQALFYVILAWIGGGLITFVVYLVVALADLPQSAQFSLRASAPAMWFAPAVVLMYVPLPVTIAISLVLIANATHQLIAQWGILESAVEATVAPASHPGLAFQEATPEAFFSGRFASILIASCTAQAGLIAVLWRYQFGAALLFALSTAILTWLAIAAGIYRPARPSRLPHSVFSVVLTFLLASTLTFGGISLRGGAGFGSNPAANDSADSAAPAEAARAAEPEPTPGSYVGFGGDFPGVILLPPKKTHIKLVAPVIAPPTAFGSPLVKAIGIPFDGPYWMYRWPATHPPRHSVVKHGDAAQLSFHTTDGWPMEMEAHQRLDAPVSVHCCQSIQIGILNSDPFPGTISMELILMDTSRPTPLTQSLGTISVGPPSATEQVVSFRMLPAADFQKFDEFKVVFHRARVRADKSAKIAIERFVLLP